MGNKIKNLGWASIAVTFTLATATACDRSHSNANSSGNGAGSNAIIAIDGSSTVFPITEAVAEEFRDTSSARVTIGVSGTGGGFQKFCAGETAITGASRPIKPTESTLCQRNSIEYVELPVAYDGISVVVHPDNSWASDITVAELATLWRPEAQREVTRWSQVRTGWPEREIHLFGPGVDSGTYDYFTKAIVGTEHSSRGDYTSSADPNVLVHGISSDNLALGFFGLAYFEANRARLKLVPVDDGDSDNGAGPIAPSPVSVANGTYQPLSRPIFIYVSKRAADRAEVRAFVEFYIAHAPSLTREVGYIPLPSAAYEQVARRFEGRVIGSLFEGSGSRIGVTVEDLLAGQH